VETINVNQTIEVITRQSISIKKEGAVVHKLDQFLESESEKSLSPSALSIYLTCPLRFYFKSVAGIKEPDEMEEQIDARLFGSIFHLVSEKFYRHFFDDSQLITEQALAEIEKDSVLLDAWIKDSFKEILMGKNSKKNFEINGKNHIAFDVIHKYLHQLIRIDKKNTPFSIVGLEMKMQMQQSFNANNRNSKVTIGGFIDRIDQTNKGLRIIDYKTGKDKLVFTDLQDLFSREKATTNKAVFQTFAYSSLVAKHYPQEPNIWPMVYQVVNFFDESKSFSVKSDKYAPFASGNFKAIETEFDESLKNLLSEIFSNDIPFIQTGEIENCEYCPYKLICGR
jgi:CRISPR/Cas system-associated exonuclease Cas4 (RecB family)